MKLYEIKDTYLALIEAMESGEIPEEAIADTLEAVEGEFSDKADNIACLHKALKAEAAAIKQEADALASRAKAKMSKADALADYLLGSMQALGKDKLETPRNVLKVTLNPPSVVVTDEQALFSTRPDLFTTPEPIPNKTAIKASLNDGAELVGVELKRGYRLGVK